MALNVRVRCLDGSPVGERTVAVLDETGAAVAAARLGGGAEGAGSGPDGFALLDLPVPEELGMHVWRVAVSAGPGHEGASRELPFSVVPRAGREVELRLRDARTGEPVGDAAAYFYAEGLRGAPERFEGSGGTVRASVAPGRSYLVRVEATRYHEASAALEAGEGPAGLDVAMESTVWDKVSLGRGGFDQF